MNAGRHGRWQGTRLDLCDISGCRSLAPFETVRMLPRPIQASQICATGCDWALRLERYDGPTANRPAEPVWSNRYATRCSYVLCL